MKFVFSVWISNISMLVRIYITDLQNSHILYFTKSYYFPRYSIQVFDYLLCKKENYLLPSHVQCKRFNAPSTLFQCWRWKKAYAIASLSPLFRICSGGRIKLFISSRYCNKKTEHSYCRGNKNHKKLPAIIQCTLKALFPWSTFPHKYFIKCATSPTALEDNYWITLKD